MDESVEENAGVAIFLYIFFGKMDESVEENEGVAIFLYIFGEKRGFAVEENEGVAIFLYIFGEKRIFPVEENVGVAIFLPFYDENVIFSVEENEGVPVFLYSVRIPPTDEQTQAESACGRRLDPSGGAPSRGTSLGASSGRKSGRADFLFFGTSSGARLLPAWSAFLAAETGQKKSPGGPMGHPGDGSQGEY